MTHRLVKIHKNGLRPKWIEPSHKTRFISLHRVEDTFDVAENVIDISTGG